MTKIDCKKYGFNQADPLAYKTLLSYAKNMRYEMTNAEICLWQYLRNNQTGFKFRRQHIIGNYIADFICIKERFIVEVDGRIHTLGEQKEHDDIRTNDLQKLGYRILRFTNDQVINETDKVVQEITEALTQY